MLGTSKSISGFDPRTIPGCQLWLDAADTNSLTLSGSSVTQWNDKSGNGGNATRLTGDSYATLTTISGNRILSFPGANAVYRSPMVLTGAAYTIFTISSLLSTSGNGSGYQRMINTDVRIFIGAVNGILSTFSGNGAWNDVNPNTPNYTLLGAGLQLVTMVVSGSSLIPYINGTAMDTKTGTTTATTVLDIGGQQTNAQHWNGYIGDIIVFNTALTTTQRQQIEGYLAHKWGLTGYYDSSIPLSIPGCQLWLDAADASTITGTTSVTAWRDKSGNARHLGVGSGTTSYSSNAIVLNSSYMFVNTPVNLTNVTVFIVTKSTGGNNQTVFTARPNSGWSWNSLDGFGFYIDAAVPRIRFYGDSTNTSQFNVNTSTTRLFSFQSSGTSINSWLEGTSQSGGSLASTRTSTAQGFAIGAEWNRDQNEYINVAATSSIYEAIVYNTALTTTQRQQIEGYLARKWGFTSMYSALPSIHPFSSIRPHLRTFQPIDVPGCQLWLDAADASTVTGTTSVTAWADKSGNGRNLGVGSGTTTYSSSAINLNSSYMLVNSPVNLTNVTVFIVSKSTGVTNQILLGAKPNTDFVYNSVDGFGFYNDPPTGRIRFYGQGDDIRQSIFFTDTSITKLYTFQSTGTTVSGWLNGTSQSGGTLTTTRTSTAQGFAIGAEWEGSSYQNILVTASIYEIIVYNTALTTSQRQQIEGYLAHKWGLTLYLPVISPLSIPGCQLWLDAADSSTLVLSGSSVTTWRDKSGLNNNATPYSTSPQRSGNSILFSGANALKCGAFLTSTTFSVFIVNNFTSGYDRISFGCWKVPFGSSVIFQDGSIRVGVNNSATYNVDATTSTPSYTNTRIYGLTLSSSSTPGSSFTFNGSIDGSNVSISGTSSSGNATTCSEEVTIGGLIRGGEANYQLIGNVYEVIVFNSALTTSQRQQVEGYLAHKWGISIGTTLPSPHPFRSIPPASLPFSPRNISGCQLWLDAADQSSMTLSGSTVTQWNDKSGNGYVMTNNQGTTSISTASLNSLTTVYTPSGTNSKITNFVGRTKCTIFLVGKAASSRYLLSLNGGFLYTANDSLLYFSPPTGNYLDIVDSVSGAIVSNNTWFILCIGYDNATNSTANPYTINGTTRSTTITPRGTPGILTDQNITSTLYINSTNGTNSYDSVYTAEILYYNDTLTTTQRQTIETYLAKKWGIGAVSSIPSTHPYSKLPPA